MADKTEAENKNDTLFNKLKKLFSSGVIVRNVGGKSLKISDTDNIQYATDRNSLRDRYNRLRSSTYNLHNRDMSLAYQAARLELFRDYDCIGEDTIIPLPDGSKPTIKELTEKYKDSPKEKFYVFSYDHDSKSIHLGNAYHPRKKGIRKAWKVTFDDGKYIIGSAGHPFLMRNGEYKKLENVTVGESVMPFYQKDFYHSGYRSIYNFSKGWQSEHVIVAEQFNHKLLENEVVHHKDFNKTNNLPTNLVIMNDADHRAYHCKINNEKIWSKENREKQILSIRNSVQFRKVHSWNGKRSGKNNPFFGKTHTIESNNKRSSSLKSAYSKIDTTGDKNSNYRDDLTFDNLKIKAIEYYKSNGKLLIDEFSKWVGCGQSSIRVRLKSNNTVWKSFKSEIESTLNHKITSIEYIGEKDVYDVTVDKYQNFATDSCFVHNTMDSDAILASALDVYADECLVPSEFGNVLTITSENEQVKKILENLFNDILNIEFNLWSWTRNLAKYGDFFLRMEISPEYGVYLVKPLSAYEITRVEGSDPQNINYVKFQHDGLGGGQEYENFEMAHFRLLSDSNFLPYGKCLKGDTYVDTEFGTTQIKDIKVGDVVWTFNSTTNKMELSTVLNQVSSGIKEIIRVRTQHNFVDCSREHPILTYNKLTEKMEYKVTDEIKIGDLLIISSNNNKQSRGHKIDKTVSEDLTCKSFSPTIDEIPDYVDEEFADFFGFMLGDGWIKKYSNGARVCFSLGTDEIQNTKYIAALEKYSGKPVRVTKVGSMDGKSRSATVYTKRLYEILRNMGFGENAKTKRIPTWVFEAPESIRLALLDGFYNADGWEFTDTWAKHCAIELCNKDLVFDIKRLVQLSNIKSSIPSSRIYNDTVEICGVSCNRSENHSIYYYPEGQIKQKMEKYDFIDSDNIFIEPVRKIEYQPEAETFDIQVESNNSNFIANGIIVHNSMLEPARRIWKQLSLMEDAMLIHRIVRAPEKRIFKVDVGNIPPAEVDMYMEKLMNKAKKVPYIDERTGDYNLRYNLNNMLEDFWLPVRGGDSGTSIDTLSGMEFTGIEDIEYLRNKMMAALKIPKAFLGYDETLSGKCVRGNTRIKLLDGRVMEIKDIAESYQNGNDPKLETYSYDTSTNSIIPGKIVECKKTRLNAELVRIHLDNGTHVDTTPDHGFVLLGGNRIDAKDLSPGNSLQAVYIRTKKLALNANEYEQLYQPNTQSWVWTHEMVDEYYSGKIINNGYTPGRVKTLKNKNKIFNHKVVSVEFITDREDTYNMEVWDKNENHNYLIDNGIIIKNSTLAAEDVRFSRTIGRMQRIIVSELSKIAVVHLFVQGYKDASLVDFELKLSNPSTVFEQEKIAIWQDKVNLAKDMMESNSFSRKWLYTKLWGLTEEEAEQIHTDVISDKKEEWRLEQITTEGNDPMMSKQKVGSDGELSDVGESGGDESSEGLPDLSSSGNEAEALPDLSSSGNEAEALPELTESDKPKKEEEPPSRQEKDERNRNRDQTGEKDSTDYPFGEDPLGTQETFREKSHRKPNRTTNPRPLRVTERSQGISMASMAEELKSIKQTLSQRNLVKNKKLIISETTSMLDESNLLADE